MFRIDLRRGSTRYRAVEDLARLPKPVRRERQLFCALKVCQPSVDFQKAVGRVPRVRRSRWGWRGHRGGIVLDLSVGADANEQRNQCEPTTHILVAACDCILLLVSSRLRLPRREQPTQANILRSRGFERRRGLLKGWRSILLHLEPSWSAFLSLAAKYERFALQIQLDPL